MMDSTVLTQYCECAAASTTHIGVNITPKRDADGVLPSSHPPSVGTRIVLTLSTVARTTSSVTTH